MLFASIFRSITAISPPAASSSATAVIRSHNRLLGSVRGVDGIKTGYTRAAGFNLVTSVQVDGTVDRRRRHGRQRPTPARDTQMRKLIATYLPKASTPRWLAT